ncbi:MAG: hypothetical protein GX242_05795, partial [Clostridiales bacterium]|nr:hypothetical protein [Clostridiales bacterium]
MSLSFLQKSNTNIIPTNQGSKTNYLAKKFGLGALGTLEGITDFVSISLAKLQGKDDLAKRLAGNNITGTLTQEIDTAFNPSGAMKVAGDISSGIGQGVTYIGAGILTGGSALGGAVVGGVSAAGGALSGAYQKTGQVGGKEFGYATLVGATEGILKGVLSPVAGKIATRLTTSVGKSTAKGIIKTVAKEGASEFLEEAIAEYANPFYEKWSGVDKNAQTSLSAPSEQFEGKTRLADILYAGALGFASGGILSGTSMVINNTRAVAVGNKIVKNNSANGLIESATAMQEYNLTNKVQVEDKAVSAFNKKLDKQNKELYDGLSRSLEQYNKQKNKESTIAKMYLGNMAGAISYIARNNGVMESYTEVVENADIYRDYINKKGVEYTSQDIIENKDGVAEQLAILHFTGKMFAEQGIDGVTTTDKASLSDSQIAIARDNATDEQASKFKADYGIDLKTASTSEIRNVLGDFNKSIPANASELTLKDGVAKFDTGKHLITVKPNGDKYDLTAVSKSGKTKTITVTESQLNEFLQANQKQAVETTQGIDSAEVESLGKEWVAGYSELSLNKRTRINEAIRSGKQFNISDNVLKGTCYIIANRNNLSIEFSDKITQNGVWHKDGKNTYAVINANMEADTIRHTVIHETFHDLNTRKDFKELVNEAYAKSLENNKAEVDERTAQYKEQFPDMTEQAIKEEIAADYFGKELSGEETFSETFSYKYKSLWQRVKLHITNLASKLRGKDSYTHSEVSEVGELFDSLIKSDNAITLKDGVKYSLDDFSKQVDQVINGTFDKENSHILVRNNTPKIFIETAGMKNLPIIISFDKLSIAMFNNGKLSNHYHNLGAATIKQIPTALESPLYIFESTNPKRIEAVIQLKDYKGRDIFTVIEFDGSGRVNGKFITANILVTAFGAQTKYIQDRVNNSKILYEAIKIGSTPQVNPRGQFPSVINESKPNIIISNSTENSNTFEKK